MALRLVHALAGLILGYGIVTGPFVFNLVFDLGAVFAVGALLLAIVAERSIRRSWPLLLMAAGFPAVVGLRTLGLPDCGPTLALGTACLAAPLTRQITVVALAAAALAIGLAGVDLRREFRP
ncbi:MAG TPA: hypothetical protein VIN74_10800 [Candidatus Limnocylindria bacterium]